MAGFVKLDATMLNSTVWINRDVRDVFITALLMCELREFREPVPQLEVMTLRETGWMVPPGWYGVAPAAGIGIVTRSGVPLDVGMAALVTMGNPEPESRNPAFEGRRLVRVTGGYVALNYMEHRDRDYGAAERMARFRARKKASKTPPSRVKAASDSRSLAHSAASFPSRPGKREAKDLERLEETARLAMVGRKTG